MKVWIMYQGHDGSGELSLGGIFSTRELARAACTDYRDQIWEETLDVVLGREPSHAEEIEFPAWGSSGLVWKRSTEKYYDMGSGDEVPQASDE